MSSGKPPRQSPKVSSSLQAVEDYLGPRYTKDYAPNGSLKVTSFDKTRQIRFDIDDFHGDPKGPHINVEVWENRNLYPGDKRQVIVKNEHVHVKP